MVVVDHHEPSSEVPDALVVDPKLADSAYPFVDLSACGVVWKLAWALRFARTELFGETVCLLNARPLHDSIVIEAVKLTNLVPGGKLFETVNPGAGAAAAERLAQFADGCEILVYDEALVRSLLTRACGPLDLYPHDLAPEVSAMHSRAAGQSLLQLRERSKLARYSDESLTELDVLTQLFTVVALRRHPELAEQGNATLDLVALSTIADLMPLRDENRILVKRGLRVLAATERVGLRELLARVNLYGKQLTTIDVSFHLSPVVNSAGRMGEAPTAVRILLTGDQAEASALVDRLLELNRQRRSVADEAWVRAQPGARRSYERTGGKLLWVIDAEVPRGVTGMLAARLMDAFHTPAIVVADQGVEASGSVRTLPGLPVADILGPLDDLLLRWGGHAMAGGFNLASSELARLAPRLERLAETVEAVADPGRVHAHRGRRNPARLPDPRGVANGGPVRAPWRRSSAAGVPDAGRADPPGGPGGQGSARARQAAARRGRLSLAGAVLECGLTRSAPISMRATASTSCFASPVPGTRRSRPCS